MRFNIVLAALLAPAIAHPTYTSPEPTVRLHSHVQNLLNSSNITSFETSNDTNCAPTSDNGIPENKTEGFSLFGFGSKKHVDYEGQIKNATTYLTKINKDLKPWNTEAGYIVYQPLQSNISLVESIYTGLKNAYLPQTLDQKQLKNFYDLNTKMFKLLIAKKADIYEVGGDYNTKVITEDMLKSLAKMTADIIRKLQANKSMTSALSNSITSLSNTAAVFRKNFELSVKEKIPVVAVVQAAATKT